MLVGKNIFLRALEPKDIELLYTWENNTEIWNLSNTLAPFSKKILQEYLEQAQLDIYATKQLRLLICLKEGKEIGCIDLFDFDPRNLRAGLGILLAEKTERKKGYAAEALLIMKDYCKDKLNLHQLYCNIGETNAASIKLFESTGFIKSGTKKEWQLISGKYLDEHFFQCIL